MTHQQLIERKLRAEGLRSEDIIESYDDVNEYGTRTTHYLVYVEGMPAIGEAHMTAIIKENEDGEVTVEFTN